MVKGACKPVPGAVARRAVLVGLMALGWSQGGGQQAGAGALHGQAGAGPGLATPLVR
ncbi:hypothetical protein [Zavarzinia sp. CC-PAN008]|uniref:hypothetical protein n=1 Tax=Zavarzinia sp. CC-PAN008 TaxID=3243332 RepID=UPI003F7438B5